MDAEAVRKVVARGVDELARAGVDTLSMVVSHRFHSLYGPSDVLEEHWRQVDKGGGYRSLREAGGRFPAVDGGAFSPERHGISRLHPHE